MNVRKAFCSFPEFSTPRKKKKAQARQDSTEGRSPGRTDPQKGIAMIGSAVVARIFGGFFRRRTFVCDEFDITVKQVEQARLSPSSANLSALPSSVGCVWFNYTYAPETLSVKLSTLVASTSVRLGYFFISVYGSSALETLRLCNSTVLVIYRNMNTYR